MEKSWPCDLCEKPTRNDGNVIVDVTGRDREFPGIAHMLSVCDACLKLPNCASRCLQDAAELDRQLDEEVVALYDVVEATLQAVYDQVPAVPAYDCLDKVAHTLELIREAKRAAIDAGVQHVLPAGHGGETLRNVKVVNATKHALHIDGVVYGPAPGNAVVIVTEEEDDGSLLCPSCGMNLEGEDPLCHCDWNQGES